ncbi:MAG TPA: hypothetical protein VGC65_07225 [Bacteroidia bacterium]|jgi:hypothetical protein
MKKITLFTLVFCYSGIALKAQDKAFEKGDITATLGIGVAIYGTKIHSEASYGSIKIVDDTTDGAASVIYPITAEYGITNWLGIGARFAYSNYFEERDSISNIKPKVTALDFDLALNFHLVKTKRFDMPIGLLIGYSRFKILSNEPNKWMAVDNGMHYGIMLNPRIYFGDHVGMYFNVGYMGYKYPSLAFSDNTDSDLNDNNNWKYSIKGNGFNIGLGLIGKF